MARGGSCRHTDVMSYDRDDEWEEDESDENDEADNELPELVWCPTCGEEIYEDAEQCPHCGNYVVHSTSALADRPLWFCLLGVLGVVATVLYLLQQVVHC